MASRLAKCALAAYKRHLMTEAVVYVKASGQRRSIDALVDRSVVDKPIGEVVVRGMKIDVLNDAELGITTTEIDVGADTIEVGERVGTTPAARGIQRIEDQDRDWLTLVVA